MLYGMAYDQSYFVSNLNTIKKGEEDFVAETSFGTFSVSLTFMGFIFWVCRLFFWNYK